MFLNCTSVHVADLLKVYDDFSCIYGKTTVIKQKKIRQQQVLKQKVLRLLSDSNGIRTHKHLVRKWN